MDDPVIAAAARMIAAVHVKMKLGEVGGHSELAKSANSLRKAIDEAGDMDRSAKGAA